MSRMFQSTGNIVNFCEVGLKISGFTPIKGHAALHLPNVLITSVTTSRTERSTVVFMGSSNGVLKKVSDYG